MLHQVAIHSYFPNSSLLFVILAISGEEVKDLLTLNTDDLEDEICDALAVMTTEIQVRVETQEVVILSIENQFE